MYDVCTSVQKSLKHPQNTVPSYGRNWTIRHLYITYIMKFSWVISWVRWFSFVGTNVSKTISVLVLRAVEILPG